GSRHSPTTAAPRRSSAGTADCGGEVIADEPLATGWSAHEPIDDSVLRRFVFNQCDAVRARASGPGARHAADDDVVMVDSGGPVPYDNMAVLLRPVTSADDPVIDRIADFYAEATDRIALLL